MKDIVIRVISISLLVVSILLGLVFISPTCELFKDHYIYSGNIEISEGGKYKLYTGFDSDGSPEIENDEIIKSVYKGSDGNPGTKYVYDKVINPNGVSNQYIILAAKKSGRTVLKVKENRFLIGDYIYVYDVNVTHKIEDIKSFEVTDDLTGEKSSVTTKHLNIFGEVDNPSDEKKEYLKLSYGSRYLCPLISNTLKGDYTFKAYDSNENPTDVIRLDDEGYLRVFAPISGYCNIYSPYTGGIRFYFKAQDSFNLYDTVLKSYEYKNKKKPEGKYLKYEEIKGLNECVYEIKDFKENKLLNCLPSMDTVVILNSSFVNLDSIFRYTPGEKIKRVVFKVDDKSLDSSLAYFNSLKDSTKLADKGTQFSLTVNYDLDIDIYPGTVLNAPFNDYIIKASKKSNPRINFKSYDDEKYNAMYSILNGSLEKNQKDGKAPLDIQSSKLEINASNSFVIRGRNGVSFENRTSRGNGYDAGNGSVGLLCGNLEIRMNNSNTFGYILGGNGGKGSNASTGGFLEGQDGCNGGNAGNGGAALIASKIKISGYGEGSNSKLYILPGVGGAGGNASYGCNGGSKLPANGGDGGNGGSNGAGALPIETSYADINFDVVAFESLSLREGHSGKGGNGWFWGSNGSDGTGWDGSGPKRVYFDESTLGRQPIAILKEQYVITHNDMTAYDRLVHHSDIFKKLYI